MKKIYWRDIAGIGSRDNSSAWFTKEQIIKEAQKLYDCEYTTIGEIVFENENFIIIAATTDNAKEDPLWSDASMIMKNVIIKIEELNSANLTQFKN